MTGQGIMNHAAWFRRPVATATWLLLAAALYAPAASAEPPMWVVRDQDSTLYLFGTVHIIDPSIEWRTPRVQKALDEATELWVEYDTPPEREDEEAAVFMPRILSPGRPLSASLNDVERAQLRKLIARTEDPQETAMMMDLVRPWFAVIGLGLSLDVAAGASPEAGLDNVLVGLARKQGDAIRSLETLEQNLAWLDEMNALPYEQQLKPLKALLALSDAELEAQQRESDAEVRAWMKGDVAPLTAMVETWRRNPADPRAAGMSYDTMLVRRNEDWARQIEGMLKGRGVAFIAVGGGHLVGPDSVQAKLAARGIKVAVH